MNIAIIGASAGVGLETVKRALDLGHHVTTLARSELLVPDVPNLTKLKGSATTKADLVRAIEHADAVIVALGTGKSMKATTLYSDYARLLVQVQQELNLDIPFIVLTGFGAGESSHYHGSWVMRMFFKYLLKDVYLDKTLMEQIIAQSPMNWVMVRPGLLKDAPLTEQYRVETKLYKGMNIGSVCRADVADFMVKQAEKPNYLHQYPALSNR